MTVVGMLNGELIYDFGLKYGSISGYLPKALRDKGLDKYDENKAIANSRHYRDSNNPAIIGYLQGLSGYFYIINEASKALLFNESNTSEAITTRIYYKDGDLSEEHESLIKEQVLEIIEYQSHEVEKQFEENEHEDVSTYDSVESEESFSEDEHCNESDESSLNIGEEQDDEASCADEQEGKSSYIDEQDNEVSYIDEQDNEASCIDEQDVEPPYTGEQDNEASTNNEQLELCKNSVAYGILSEAEYTALVKPNKEVKEELSDNFELPVTSDINKYKKACAVLIENIRKEYSQKLEKENQRRLDELSDLEHRHENNIKRLRHEHESIYSAMEEKLRIDASELALELMVDKEAYKELVNKAARDYELKKEELDLVLEEKIAQLESEKEESINNYLMGIEDELTMLRNDNLKAEIEKNKALAELKEIMLSNQAAATSEALLNCETRLRKEFEERLDLAKNLWDKDKDKSLIEQQKRHAEEIINLKDKHESIMKEFTETYSSSVRKYDKTYESRLNKALSEQEIVYLKEIEEREKTIESIQAKYDELDNWVKTELGAKTSETSSLNNRLQVLKDMLNRDEAILALENTIKDLREQITLPMQLTSKLIDLVIQEDYNAASLLAVSIRENR